jgi:hypothetical protein
MSVDHEKAEREFPLGLFLVCPVRLHLTGGFLFRWLGVVRVAPFIAKLSPHLG